MNAGKKLNKTPVIALLVLGYFFFIKIPAMAAPNINSNLFTNINEKFRNRYCQSSPDFSDLKMGALCYLLYRDREEKHLVVYAADQKLGPFISNGAVMKIFSVDLGLIVGLDVENSRIAKTMGIYFEDKECAGEPFVGSMYNTTNRYPDGILDYLINEVVVVSKPSQSDKYYRLVNGTPATTGLGSNLVNSSNSVECMETTPWGSNGFVGKALIPLTEREINYLQPFINAQKPIKIVAE